MKLALFLAIAGLCSAQNYINAGGPTVSPYFKDAGFAGGASYGPAQDPSLGTIHVASVFRTLRYGTSFSYDLKAPQGSCSVTFLLLENRPAVATATVPASGVGKRLFSITGNGVSTGIVDIFAAVGAQTEYRLTISPVPIKIDGHLRITFSAVKGNAVVSGIEPHCTIDTVSPVTASSVLPPIFRQ